MFIPIGTRLIIHNIKEKFYNLKRYKARGRQLDHELYNYYRKRVKILISIAYSNYTKKPEGEAAAFWQYVRDRSSIHELIVKKAAESGTAFASHIAIDKLTIADIRRSVGKLTTSSSPGPDLISSFVIKDCFYS